MNYNVVLSKKKCKLDSFADFFQTQLAQKRQKVRNVKHFRLTAGCPKVLVGMY